MATTTRDTTSNIRHCQRCGAAYDWRRSASSSLKMTFCGSLCERGGIGFTIEGLLEFVGGAGARADSAGTRTTANRRLDEPRVAHEQGNNLR